MTEHSEFQDGPGLIIDHMVMYQIISDDKFWSEVPAFAFMKNSSKHAVQQIVSQIVDSKGVSDCAGCSSLRPLTVPILIVFGQHIAQLKQDSPEALNDLVDYIASRRGYRPVPIAVYYKDEGGKSAKVEF